MRQNRICVTAVVALMAIATVGVAGCDAQAEQSSQTQLSSSTADTPLGGTVVAAQQQRKDKYTAQSLTEHAKKYFNRQGGALAQGPILWKGVITGESDIALEELSDTGTAIQVMYACNQEAAHQVAISFMHEDQDLGYEGRAEECSADTPIGLYQTPNVDRNRMPDKMRIKVGEQTELAVVAYEVVELSETR